MPSNYFEVTNGKFGITFTDPAVTDACSAQLSAFTDFGCNLASGALNPTSNATTKTVPATWCAPEESVDSVGLARWTAGLTLLQDPQVADGILSLLVEHDAERAWIYLGMDGDNPPKAVAEVQVSPAAWGGAARTPLTSEVSFVVKGRPMFCFGTAGNSRAVPDPNDLTFAVFANTAPPADLATLKADPTFGDGNLAYNSGGDFTAGQYVRLGDGSQAHYDTAVWVAGPAT